MNALSIGDRVRPGPYRLHARFPRSVLLIDASQRMIFVVAPSLGPGPLNVVVPDPHALVSNQSLIIPRPIPGPRYHSAMPRLIRASREILRQTLVHALRRHAPPDSLVSLLEPPRPASSFQQSRDDYFRNALAMIQRGRLAQGVRLLRGCGQGLTPSGDDFLCGWMLACRLRRSPATAKTIHGHARANNPVSNAFLEMAAQGRIPLPIQRLLHSPDDAHVRAVCAFGHTSGADLLCGLAAGLNGPFPETPRLP